MTARKQAHTLHNKHKSERLKQASRVIGVGKLKKLMVHKRTTDSD